MGIFSNQIKNNESANFVYTNINEVVKTDWTTVKIKTTDDDGNPKFVDEPMVPFSKFSPNAKDVIDCEVVPGDYDSYILKLTTFYGGYMKYAIHRDCSFQLGEHPKVEDLMVVRLVKGEAAKYTADALTNKIFNEQQAKGNVCFKLLW